MEQENENENQFKEPVTMNRIAALNLVIDAVKSFNNLSDATIFEVSKEQLIKYFVKTLT